MNITVNEDCTRENYRISDEMMKNWGIIKKKKQEIMIQQYIFSFREEFKINFMQCTTTIQ